MPTYIHVVDCQSVLATYWKIHWISFINANYSANFVIEAAHVLAVRAACMLIFVEADYIVLLMLLTAIHFMQTQDAGLRMMA